MNNQLTISIGQYSHRGRKPVNQDFIGARVPRDPLLTNKGIVVAIADGISSSNVSQIASETAVAGFIEDYYCTPDAWSAKHSAQRVLQAINSWLYSQTRNSPYRFNKDKGYICTFSTLILKSHTAHILHSGDTRIYRLSGQRLEPLTDDHRHVLDEQTSYLTSALGVHAHLEIDYHKLNIELGDVFILVSDGIYEFFDEHSVIQSLQTYHQDLNQAAASIGKQALERGSDDNLSIQIVRVEALGQQQISELSEQASITPLPPRLEARTQFDGYTIIRELYISSRSHVYLAKDNQHQQSVVIKVPSTEGRNNPRYLERFLMEDWISRRLDNTHILKAVTAQRKRQFLYLVTEYIDGQTLHQWMQDNPRPDLHKVRQIIGQVAKGLQAFHRQEMIHRDLRPNNIMIDASGTVKIIDFGSTRVAGVSESREEENVIYGTALYTAPEYFLGEAGDERGDIFSLGVIAYQMLSGELPYGTRIARAQGIAAQRKLRYRSLPASTRDIPAWVDECLRKAVHLTPTKRYRELSEFIYDLEHPNPAFINKHRSPLIERNPVLVWQCISLALFLLLLAQWW